MSVCVAIDVSITITGRQTVREGDKLQRVARQFAPTMPSKEE